MAMSIRPDVLYKKCNYSEGAKPHRRELKGTICGVATGRPQGSRGGQPHRRELKSVSLCGGESDRKGRDGVNPSTTHLLVVRGKMCRRGGLSPRDHRGRSPHRTPYMAFRSRLWRLAPVPTRGFVIYNYFIHPLRRRAFTV